MAHFLSALPRHFSWKVRATRDEQSIVAHSRKRSGKPKFLRKRREFIPRKQRVGAPTGFSPEGIKAESEQERENRPVFKQRLLRHGAQEMFFSGFKKPQR